MRRFAFAALAALACASPAHAACDASNQFTLDWNGQASAALSYAATYNYTVSNALGATRTVQARFTTNGLATNVVAGVALPAIGVVHTGTLAATEKTLTIGGQLVERTPAIGGATNIITVTLTFSSPVRDVSFRVFGIDSAKNNKADDWVKVSGSDGTTTYDAALTQPAASTVKLGPDASPPALGTGEAVGTTESGLNEDVGTIAATFLQPVTTVTLRYGNYPRMTGAGNTDEQWLSIHDIAFCPMPNVSITKSSTPYAATGPDRFNVPGADIAYALTVTNSGGSPVDLASLVLSDTLPANVTFYNGDYNAGSPGMGPFLLVAGASGVTLPAGSAAYSQNGATWSATAGAGYDPLVRYIRLSPAGSLAANSSVVIYFRARVS